MQKSNSPYYFAWDSRLSAKAIAGWTGGVGKRRREPPSAMMADLRSANDVRHLCQFNTAANSQSNFLLSMLARRLKVVVQVGPIPPVVEKTNGTKLAPSTSWNLCSYRRLLLCSCFEFWLTSNVVIAEGAFGWTTRTSNRDLDKRSPQKTRARMSRRASSVRFALPGSCSPSSGWRGGSSVTSWHTSCITLAVKFRRSLYGAAPSTLQWRKTMHGWSKTPARKRSVSAVRGEMVWLADVAHAEGIMEGWFWPGEAMAGHWEDGEPAARHL